jgi:hypothetical protein
MLQINISEDALESLLFDRDMTGNAIRDFAKLAEILIPVLKRVGDAWDLNYDANYIEEELEKAIDIIVNWCG